MIAHLRGRIAGCRVLRRLHVHLYRLFGSPVNRNSLFIDDEWRDFVTLDNYLRSFSKFASYDGQLFRRNLELFLQCLDSAHEFGAPHCEPSATSIPSRHIAHL